MLLLLLACNPSPTKVPDTADSGYAWRDTSAVVDTGDTALDTSESGVESGESGDTSRLDTGDTGEAGWVALDVWPSAIVVHVGASWSLRVVGTDTDGGRSDLPSRSATPAYASDDPTIAAVDADGRVSSLAEGSTTLRVMLDGVEATATVEVRTDGVATITIVDTATGLPVPGARVALPFTAPVEADAYGVALLPVTDPGPITFSAWNGDTYDALTVTGVVGRALRVDIGLKDTPLRSASVAGQVDYAGVDDAEWTEVVAGFAAASIQGALAATPLEDLFADTRTLDVSGLTVDAPANLYIEGIADDYAATAAPGVVSVWGLAGPLPMADTLDGFAGTGDALELLADNLPAMSWGQQNGVTTSADTTSAADLAPSDRFDAVTALLLPALSSGFFGDERWIVLVTEERVDEGYVVTGLGSGAPSGELDVPTVPAGTVPGSLGTNAVAYAQVGGIGSGGPASASLARTGSDGTLSFAVAQDVADLHTWDPAARTLGFTVDPDAHFVRVRLRDERNRIHDILTPASWSGEIPNCVTSFGMAGATVEVLSLETSEGSYEGWLATGDLAVDTKTVVTAARTQE